MKQLKVVILIVFTFLYISDLLYAQSTNDTLKTIYKQPVILNDNPIVAALDSLSLLKCFEKSNSDLKSNQKNKNNYPENFIPVFSDSIYKIRIAKLNSKSPFGLIYNEDVNGFINLYAVRKRQLTSRILGLSEYYFPLFEEYLDKYNLPLELKYLAIVESALNPVAKSPAGAKGLWQFMYGTGKMYGLQVTSYIDDRSDPVKATIAACEHFKDLYALYKDWSLVLAAYNSGAGNVNKAIRRANGEMDFWKIKKFLPKETQGYVPAFIAVIYVMNYSSEHNLYPVAPTFMSYDIDTVMVKQKLTFAQISEALNIPLDDIKYINPCYKEGVIPVFDNEKFPLYLPKQYIGDFITNETTIYAYKTKAMIEEEKIQAEKQKEIHRKDSLLALQKQKMYKKNQYAANVKKDDFSKQTVKTANNDSLQKSAVKLQDKIYIVKHGDGLGIIASKYNCTVAQLQAWNGLKNMTIHPGQKLFVQDISNITVVKDTANTKNTVKTEAASEKSQPVDTSVQNSKNTQAKYIYHTVQKGDTLWDIAIKYKVVTVDEIKRLNNLSGNHVLYVGQKLKIAVTG